MSNSILAYFLPGFGVENPNLLSNISKPLTQTRKYPIERVQRCLSRTSSDSTPAYDAANFSHHLTLDLSGLHPFFDLKF